MYKCTHVSYNIFPPFLLIQGGANLKKKAKKIFLAEKPAPVLESLFKGTSKLLKQKEYDSYSHRTSFKFFVVVWLFGIVF